MTSAPATKRDRPFRIVREGMFVEVHQDLPEPAKYAALMEEYGLVNSSSQAIGLKIVPPDGTKSVMLIARPDVIEDVLRNASAFGLQNYDDAFKTQNRNDGYSGLKFFLSEDERQYKLKRDLIGRVFGHCDHKARISDLNMTEIAADYSASVRDAIRKNTSGNGSFDILRDYGAMVIYLVTVRAFGLRGSARSGFWVWLLRTARALLTGRRFRLTPLSREMQNMSTSCQLFFLQLFGNFRNRNKAIQKAGLSVGKSLQRDCRKLLANSEGIAPESLAAKMLEAKEQMQETGESEYKQEELQQAVEEMLLEFVTTLMMIVQIGFAGVLKSLHQSNKNFKEVSQTASNIESGSAFINEALRLHSPTGMVFRRAKEDARLGGDKVEKDEDLILLIGVASMHEEVFSSPGELQTHRPEGAYLHFGPYEGVHACLGQLWAKEILRQMLIALSDFEGLKFEEELRTFFGQAESWRVSYSSDS